MEDYRKMYYKLFNDISDIIERLQTVQREMEEEYLEATENNKEDLQ